MKHHKLPYNWKDLNVVWDQALGSQLRKMGWTIKNMRDFDRD